MDTTAPSGRARAVPDTARPIPSDIQSASWARAFEAVTQRLAPHFARRDAAAHAAAHAAAYHYCPCARRSLGEGDTMS
jgi:hypothetical protein